MDELSERIELLHQSGFVDGAGRADLRGGPAWVVAGAAGRVGGGVRVWRGVRWRSAARAGAGGGAGWAAEPRRASTPKRNDRLRQHMFLQVHGCDEYTKLGVRTMIRVGAPNGHPR